MTDAVDNTTTPRTHENNASQPINIAQVSQPHGKDAVKDITFGSVCYLSSQMRSFNSHVTPFRLLASSAKPLNIHSTP